MFGKIITAFLFIFPMISCANPKYYTRTNDTGGGNPQVKLDGCQAQFASGHCVSFVWEILPKDNSKGSFLFKTYRSNTADGTPVLEDLTAGAMSVVLWMPSMGHGSSPVAVERLDVGTYRAKDVFFVMKGEWEIRFQLKDGNEVKDQAIISIAL